MLDNPLKRSLRGQKVYEACWRAMTVDDWEAEGWERDKAEKYAETGDARVAMVSVIVPPESSGATGYMYPLHHYPFHSPSGFGWGYGGSGPAELARCILIDWFEATASNDDDGRYFAVIEPPLPVSYQDFKDEFIASAPDRGFTLRGRKIAEWVAFNSKVSV